MKTNTQGLELSPQIPHGRAINAVADYLRRTLSVPNIFIKPSIFPGLPIDILAVDHGGAGDLHAGEVKLQPDIEAGFRAQLRTPRALKSIDEANRALHEQHLPRKAREFHEELMSLPTHYRYLAILEEYRDNLFGHFAPLGLYSPDGIGRIGLITLFQVRDRLPEVQIAVAPERFRVDPKRIAAIDRFLQKAKPDMEIRI